ncbi:hypothetical protein ACFFX0_29440 [Citricoccus parietis]|uniref:Uncharacterized protein n=1 Tax=Citricoccus parietis TaxID=592307 RepID=A0ABV5G802_9MICC
MSAGRAECGSVGPWTPPCLTPSQTGCPGGRLLPGGASCCPRWPSSRCSAGSCCCSSSPCRRPTGLQASGLRRRRETPRKQPQTLPLEAGPPALLLAGTTNTKIIHHTSGTKVHSGTFCPRRCNGCPL